MDANKSIVLASGQELLVRDIKPQVEETARKLMKLTPGGKNLDINKATELAVFSLVNGLNPFEGEAYNGEMGCVAGVAGYRRKAREYLLELYGPQANYSIEYVPATTQEADFNPDNGDVAWKVILHDSEREKGWMRQVIENLKGLKDAGMEDEHQRYTIARELAGPRPSIEAVGVVKANEHFSGIDWENWDKKITKKDANGNTLYKPESWDRNERAKKRAEKQAIRRMYPVGVRIIGDAEMGEAVDATVREVAAEVSTHLSAVSAAMKDPARTVDSTLKELGIDPGPAPAPAAPDGPPEPEYVDVVDATFTTAPAPAKVTPAQALVDAGIAPDIYQANGMVTRYKGKKQDTETILAWGRIVAGWLDIGADLEQATSKANKGEKP